MTIPIVQIRRLRLEDDAIYPRSPDSRIFDSYIRICASVWKACLPAPFFSIIFPLSTLQLIAKLIATIDAVLAVHQVHTKFLNISFLFILMTAFKSWGGGGRLHAGQMLPGVNVPRREEETEALSVGVTYWGVAGPGLTPRSAWLQACALTSVRH